MLFVVVLLPSSEEECGPGQSPVSGQQNAGTSCAATGLPAEQGLNPGALKVMRCVVAHFGIKDVGGARADEFPDHPSGNAVDFMIDGSGKSKGDDIVAFLQQNSAAFGIDYILWQ